MAKMTAKQKEGKRLMKRSRMEDMTENLGIILFLLLNLGVVAFCFIRLMQMVGEF